MNGTVIVTGAADGLGRVIAGELLARGRLVVLVDRDAERVQESAAELGDRAEIAIADLADLDAVRRLGAALAARDGIAGLVNNAGGVIPGEQYPAAAPDRWMSALTLNLLAPMLLTQLLWSRLAAASGSVVNVGSSGGVGTDGYWSPEYGAAKAGVHRLTASLASRTDVRVTAVVPGWIGLDRAHREWAELSDGERRDAGSLVPPDDIARETVRLLEHGRPGEVVHMLQDGERISCASS